MNNLNEFLHMGGYGQYVWSAYGITFVAMLLALLIPLKQHGSLKKRLKRQLNRQSKSKSDSRQVG